MAKKMFIFDYDGVIADSLKNCIDIINAAGEKYHLPGRINSEKVGKFPHITMHAALFYMGMTKAESSVIGAEVLDNLQKNALTVQLFPGIDNIFKLIHSTGNILTINTANSSRTVTRRMENAGLLEYISHIEGADMPGEKAEKILKIIKQFNFTKENTYMIGDSMGDITEAHRAGIKAIAVTYGWQTREILETVKPDHICSTIQELKEYIATL